MVLYREIVRARLSGDIDALTEASLGRVFQHVKKSGKNASLVLITAFRSGRTKKENLAANKRLEQEVRSLGYGLFKIIGHWRECKDNTVPYKKCPEDKLVDVKEMTFGVPGMDRETAKKLTKKYDQDGSVYVGPDTKGKAIVIERDGGSFSIGAFTPQKVVQGWSQVRGGHWTFEGFDYPPQSCTEVLIEKASRVVERIE
jgi:hypothetical protein